MKISYALLATFACLVLAFCIAAAITAQASHTWWEIEKNNTSNRYYFGLYRVCVEKANKVETCYQFNVMGIKIFAEDELRTPGASKPVVISENLESRNVWILSFFAILFTGMAFLVAVPTACMSYTCSIHKCVPIIQCIFTAIGTILGVTSVAYAYGKRHLIWESGVTALKEQNFTTDKVNFVGQGFLYQCLYTTIEAIACICYIIMITIQPVMRKVAI